MATGSVTSVTYSLFFLSPRCEVVSLSRSGRLLLLLRKNGACWCWVREGVDGSRQDACIPEVLYLP